MGIRPKGAGRLVCSLTGLHNQELGRGICAFKRADHKKNLPAPFKTGTTRQPLACLRQIKAAQLWTG